MRCSASLPISAARRHAKGLDRLLVIGEHEAIASPACRRCWHRRKDRAQPIFAVQPLFDEGDRAIDRAGTQLLRKQGLDHPANTLSSPRNSRNQPQL